ncbi:hypothetical protein OG895_21885 [Streptomyces sp. NBC_00201]|nr:hypothetical protein [Streptomyces sp. NBC_00201]MCX5247829.1 hypothetical protein [Streptomyces sp. NBC_00201]
MDGPEMMRVLGVDQASLDAAAPGAINTDAARLRYELVCVACG